MNVDKMKGKIIISLSNKGKSDLARTFDFCQFLKAQLLLKTFSVIFLNSVSNNPGLILF